MERNRYWVEVRPPRGGEKMRGELEVWIVVDAVTSITGCRVHDAVFIRPLSTATDMDSYYVHVSDIVGKEEPK